MLRTITRAPVLPMPHIWSPMFLDKRIQFFADQGQDFGFKPHDDLKNPRAWRAAIFEPNISVAKNCVIAMLACEAAYRSNKDTLSLMMVMNSYHMKEHQTFNRFALNLDLTRENKASYEPRMGFVDGMINHQIDVVVSHQWENAQNYLYYDALHGGFPLVHNSPFLQKEGLGFYYPEFDAQIGGDQLIHAWQKDAGYWSDYRDRSAMFLKTLLPTNKHNVDAFMQRINHLTGASA